MTPLQKLPKNVVDLCKLIVTTGFEKLPKVQSGHAEHESSPITTRQGADALHNEEAIFHRFSEPKLTN